LTFAGGRDIIPAMILSPNVIDAIHGKKLKLSGLQLELTRRCNLKCRHCYKGAAENLDMDARIPGEVLDYFKDIEFIQLYGGESQLNPDGLAQIYDALKTNKTRFNQFSFVTNGAIFNRDFFEILRGIESAATRVPYFHTADVAVSNDFWHAEGGADAREVAENVARMRAEFPTIHVGLRRFKKKSDFEFKIYPLGNAKKFDQSEKEYFYDFQFQNEDELLINYNKDKSRFFHVDPTLKDFTFDARGNAIPQVTDYETGDRKNFGNIFTKPISQIILDSSRER
jgi:sulfatase maturation enzyme AslB (radical SAM superfamily)